MSRMDSSSPEAEFDNKNQQASSAIYSALSPGCIRTLQILPSDNALSEDVECILCEAPLSTSTSYRALSYVWGSKANPDTIKLDGKTYLVTQNLMAALKHLRAMGIDDALWIDALCIDQANTSERGIQVQQMSQIYEKADSVLLWLGSEADGSTSVLEKISTGAAENFSPQWMAGLIENGANGNPNAFFAGLMYLMTREYWNRLWIVQEIAWAREVVVCCGLTQLSYSALLNFLKVVKHHELGERTALSWVGRVIRQYLGACGPVGLKAPGSARLLNAFEDPTWILARHAATKKCSDSRDRIYGCHGLFQPELRNLIPIDYSKDPGELIRSATISIIEVTRRLEIILLKRRNENGLRAEPWEAVQPSWIPVLDDKWGEAEIFFDAIDPRLQSSACHSREAICRFSMNNRLLEAKGVLLGRVNYSQQRNYRPGDHMFGQEHEQLKMVEYIFDFRRHLGDRLYSKPELMAFWSTVLGSFMEQYLVMTTAKDQEGTGTFRHVDTTSTAVLGIAVDMQNINSLIEGRQSLMGWVKSFLKVPLLTKYQLAFLEQIYRHLDYRGLFCFERAIPDSREHHKIVDGEALRPLDIGIGPVAVKEGDVLSILYGCRVPVILRPKGEHYQVIGDAYLSDFMNGEALDMPGAGSMTQIFCLE